ncbi:MAG: metal-sulfur cluster assembly factor [Candidatus Magasanikbacteria bacterium]|nr:metal-sulfur cluster assembly factor [Candidatus Magasanikbacteria bacterium]
MKNKKEITKDQVIEVLKTVLDPEVHLDIWTMGLIYNIEIKDKGVDILMTYTTPFCPWGPQLNDELTTALKEQLGIKNVNLTITFDPPYTMPPEMRAMFGI